MAVTGAVRAELLDATDEQIDDAVRYADPMVLRGLLYQLTGDEEVARTEVAIAPGGPGRLVASDADVALLRRKAADFLKAYRDAGAGPMDPGLQERLPTSVMLVAGHETSEDATRLCIEELGLDPWVRSLDWRKTPDPDALQNFSVTVIGAGLGGLGAALMLKRAGIPFTVIEKNSGVGGTWWENRYPGARVDTPSRGYTNIFGVDFEYPNPYCPWTENQRYFDWVADNFDLRADIVFDTEVLSLSWDEASCEWEILVEGAEGRRTHRSNAVVTAVGFLNRPKVPELEGMAQFGGPSWHTARWPDDYDLKGKRIAVIGTGCTGYQLVPELALEAHHVVVFQRTPQWLVGVPGYLAPFPPQVMWLDRNLPYHTNFMRLRSMVSLLSWGQMTEIDPDFEDPHAVSFINKRMRDASVAFLKTKVHDPELVAKMTPEHPPWSARPVIVDAEYCVLDAIQRDNVTLVTDRIRRVDRTGIEAGDRQYDVDAIVFATGFHASDYLFPMTITGRNGRTIEDLWKDGGARAYTFCMVPDFPNLWMIYGPNTNGGIGPGAFHELVTVYALRCIERLIADGKRSIEPTEDAYWRFNAEVDERNSRKVWSDPRSESYYWTQHGRSAVMCPFNPDEIWRLLREPDFEGLEIR